MVGRICRKKGMKPGMKKWVGDGRLIIIIISMNVSSMTTV